MIDFLIQMNSDFEDDNIDHDDGAGSGTAVITESDIKAKLPRKYKVFLHNDDYTPMEFVVQVLMTIFRMSHEQAYTVMLEVHNKGLGVAGVYSYEVAETKVAKVLRAAREMEFPLRCSMEPE